jgi:hypothetical protein
MYVEKLEAIIVTIKARYGGMVYVYNYKSLEAGQEDHEFEASLCYTVRPCLKKHYFFLFSDRLVAHI